MKKAQIFLLTALTVSMLIGCGNTNEVTADPTTPESNPAVEESITPETTEEPIVEEIVTDEAPGEGYARSYLTNEWVTEEVANTRPIAVMTPNEVSCIPHYGLAEASILYEVNVEGRMTRLMAIYEDWTEMEKIGNIRSLRAYYGYWATEWDPFIVHFGGPYYISDMLASTKISDLDLNVMSGDYSFRTTDRKAPHNAYSSGSQLVAAAESKGYDLEVRDKIDDEHFQFAGYVDQNTLEQYSDAVDATYIDMSGAYPLTRCYFEYNEADGLYYRSQHLSGAEDGPHIDGATGEQLSFKNVLVQNTYYETLDAKGYLTFQCQDTTRDGWFFTNGKGIHVNWEKTSDYGATRYYDDNGKEITLNTGKTMICIVEDGDTISYK